MGYILEIVIKTYANFNRDMYKAGKKAVNKYLCTAVPSAVYLISVEFSRFLGIIIT